MPGRGLDTTSRVSWHTRGNGCRKGFAAHLVVFVTLVVALVLGVASTASASSNFYWYGEGNSNCWQTGQPGASSSTCDNVGEWFLNSSPTWTDYRVG
jgi:hypothetical protein